MSLKERAVALAERRAYEAALREREQREDAEGKTWRRLLAWGATVADGLDAVRVYADGRVTWSDGDLHLLVTEAQVAWLKNPTKTTEAVPVATLADLGDLLAKQE